MTLQGALFLPQASWKPPRLSELPSWRDVRRLSIDIETCDPDLKKTGPGVRRQGFIAGIGFAIEDGPGFYLPIAHAGGDNLNRELVLDYISDNAVAFSGDLVGTNLTYDLDYLAEAGVEFPQVRWFRDVQVAEPLLDELQDRYSLDAIAQRYRLGGKDQSLMQDAAEAYGLLKKESLRSVIWKLPGRFVADYCTQDCFLPLDLLRRQERRIEEQDLWDIYNLESRVLPVLLRMRRRGIRFSHDRLSEVERWSVAEETKALDFVAHETNVRVPVGEVWVPDHFARVLKEIGVTPSETKTGQPSITAELLASLKHPVATALARARKVNKIRSTFVASIREHAIGDRIHCTLNQLRREKDDGGLGGAAYGRLSSEHPNMQQQPARDPELGPLWRSIYIPDEGGLWACCDYSQQEPRLLTHYAEILGLKGAKEAAERYRTDPKTDNHQMMADLTGLPRKQAKNIFLGLCYGMGSARLAHELGLPTDWIFSKRWGRMIEVAGPEAKAILDQFNRRAPYVRALARKCEDAANKKGYIRTLLNRRCRFPSKEGGGWDWTQKAGNRLIQGGAADQTKAAMVAADEENIPLQLQVHDELDLTVENPDRARELAQIMREVVVLHVPSRVDPLVGPSWGELTEVA